MKFSAKEQYGLRAMVELARCYGQGPVSLADVAQAEGLSLPYLEQIAADLRRAGLLESRRGAYGGYLLARPPAEISVADIIIALEGSLVQVPCVADGDAQEGAGCARETVCATRGVWLNVHQHLVELLDSLTLADLIGQQSAETEPGGNHGH
ncbi:MAG: RrF2 family transcriptional regulator [Anaerolineae bacterium]